MLLAGRHVKKTKILPEGLLKGLCRLFMEIQIFVAVFFKLVQTVDRTKKVRQAVGTAESPA
jgi:hypothetical protein